MRVVFTASACLAQGRLFIATRGSCDREARKVRDALEWMGFRPEMQSSQAMRLHKSRTVDPHGPFGPMPTIFDIRREP